MVVSGAGLVNLVRQQPLAGSALSRKEHSGGSFSHPSPERTYRSHPGIGGCDSLQSLLPLEAGPQQFHLLRELVEVGCAAQDDAKLFQAAGLDKAVVSARGERPENQRPV